MLRLSRDPSDKEVLYGANRTHRSAGVGGPDPAGARGFFNGARRQWDRRGDPAFPDEPRAGGRHPYQPHHHTHLRHRRGGRVPGHPGASRPGDSVYRRRVAVSHVLPEERRAGAQKPRPFTLGCRKNGPTTMQAPTTPSHPKPRTTPLQPSRSTTCTSRSTTSLPYLVGPPICTSPAASQAGTRALDLAPAPAPGENLPRPVGPPWCGPLTSRRTSRRSLRRSLRRTGGSLGRSPTERRLLPSSSRARSS